MFNPPFIANETKRFSFKGGCVVRVKNSECVASYSQRRLRLSVYITAKDVYLFFYFTNTVQTS